MTRHHVVHRINGGSTDLDNLVLLSSPSLDGPRGWLAARQIRGGQMLTIPPTVTFGLARAPD
ncbi:MAG: HNH endonuclease [Candidatus Dormibacteraceae bacterium]